MAMLPNSSFINGSRTGRSQRIELLSPAVKHERMKIQQFTTQWGGRELTVEVGRLAQQADASCTVRYGDTMVIATAVMSKETRPGMGWFPLMVDFEEKYYAAGKIKGSRFIKKEGRPSDEAVLAGRMIDRTIRPLFNSEIRNDIQVIISTMSFDEENDPDVLGIIGASIVLHMSQIPWDGPVGGIRMGKIEDKWVVNPTYAEREVSELDLVVCGTPGNLLMVEAGANIVKDDVLVEGIEKGLEELKPVVDLIEEIRDAVGSEKTPISEIVKVSDEEREANAKIEELALPFIAKKTDEYFFSTPLATKGERTAQRGQITKELKEYLLGEGIDEQYVGYGAGLVYEAIEDYISKQILASDRRVDGRGMDEIRDLVSDVGFIPRTHGSGLFMRGETQVMSIVTLAGPSAEQIVDTMEMDIKKRYMHHYSFPPYSVGEARPMRGPGRREIGHGALAEKALMPVLPPQSEFPYTIRVVSETLGSNGSSSMGSACGSSLSLMDAGVPISAPVAGLAIGLASTPDMSEWKVFTDLQDLEDGPGGMDFKITGTRDGVTAVQLDTKTTGLNMEIVKAAFEHGKAGRLQILDIMQAAIEAPRAELSEYAPRIESVMIDPEKIRVVIGPGGKQINEIIDKTGVDIDIQDDGTVSVTSKDGAAMKEALDWISMLVAEVEVGKTYHGTVTRLMDFGAFVEILPKQEGLVHISEMAPYRVEKVSDIVKVGDKVYVKVLEIDSMERVNLSMKQAEGNTFPPAPKGSAGGDRPRGGQGGSRGTRQSGGRDGGGRAPRGGSRPQRRDK